MSYAQCRLERPSTETEGATEVLVAWIPGDLAVVGKRLEFSRRDEDGRALEPDRGWVVAEVHSRATERDVRSMEAYREPFARAIGHPDVEFFDRERGGMPLLYSGSG